jgi:hypothetical protein
MSKENESFKPKLAEKTPTNWIFSMKQPKSKFKSVDRKEFCGISHIIGRMTSNCIVFKQNKLYLNHLIEIGGSSAPDSIPNRFRFLSTEAKRIGIAQTRFCRNQRCQMIFFKSARSDVKNHPNPLETIDKIRQKSARNWELLYRFSPLFDNFQIRQNFPNLATLAGIVPALALSAMIWSY